MAHSTCIAAGDALPAPPLASTSAEAELLRTTSAEAERRAYDSWAPTAVPLILHQSWKNCTLPLYQRVWQWRCDEVLPPSWNLWLWTGDGRRRRCMLVHAVGGITSFVSEGGAARCTACLSRAFAARVRLPDRHVADLESERRR